MVKLLRRNSSLIPQSQYLSLNEEEFINELKLDIKDKIIAVDTETEGLFDFENKIVMLQIGTSNNNQYVIDARDSVPKEIIDILADNSILKLFWNVKFDYQFILNDFNVCINNVYDGFIAELCLQCGIDRELQVLSLGDNSVKYLGKKLNKDIRNKFVGLAGKQFSESQILYGAEDVQVLFEIRKKQLELIKELKLENIVNLENEAVLVLADMEYNGMPFNAEKWLKLAKTASKSTAKQIEALDKYVLNNSNKFKKFICNKQLSMFADINSREVTIDWGSPTSLLRVFKADGLDVDAVNKIVLTKYKNNSELVNLFIEYQRVKKLETTYGSEFLKNINKITGRIHTNFWPIIDTHRVSSSSPNMQQIPSHKDENGSYAYLECFECGKLTSLVSRDYAGQELRVIAEGSKDSLWVTAFNEDRDLHSEIAVLMFNIDLKDVKNNYANGKSYRDIAKTINFGLAYGMTEYRLSNIMGIAVDDAKKLIDLYFSKTAGLKIYFDKCIEFAAKKGYIRSYLPYSAIRWLNRAKLNEGQVARRAMNTPIQTTGACMTKKAMVDLRHYINNNNLNDIVKLVLPVHDAIMSETLDSFAEEWGKIKGEIMINAGKMFVTKVPIKTDLTINKYWTK